MQAGLVFTYFLVSLSFPWSEPSSAPSLVSYNALAFEFLFAAMLTSLLTHLIVLLPPSYQISAATFLQGFVPFTKAAALV